jgi:hypothetical protein
MTQPCETSLDHVKVYFYDNFPVTTSTTIIKVNVIFKKRGFSVEIFSFIARGKTCCFFIIVDLSIYTLPKKTKNKKAKFQV